MLLVLCFVLSLLVFLSCSKDRPPTAPASKANCLICGSLELPHETNPDVSTAQDTTSTTEQDTTSTDARSQVEEEPEEVSVADSLALLDDSLAFNIELVFEDGFPEWEKTLIQDAKHYWEKQLSDVPDYTLKQTINVSTSDIPAGTVVDDLLIYVSTRARYGEGHNWGTAYLFREDSGLPVVGEIQLVLKRWAYEDGRMDFTDPAMSQEGGPYHEYTQSFTALHEIGHVLGIGVGKNWYNLLQEGDLYPYFAGERAIEAYNALPRLVRVDYHQKNIKPRGGISLNIFGYDKPIVSNQPSGILYRGDKVPVHGGNFGGGGHWGATTGQELMSYGTSRTPYHAYIYSYGLSTITLGALEDMGYPVRHGFTDPFWVTVDENGNPLFPISSAKPTVFLEEHSAFRCEVGRP